MAAAAISRLLGSTYPEVTKAAVRDEELALAKV
jgi:hypothetical protein